MNKLLIILLCLYTTANADIIQDLLPALATVESNNDINAVGDNGKAKGILQIWNVVILDVNRVYKTNYTHNDMFNKDNAFDVATKYLTYWGKQYTKKTNKQPTIEVYARLWNGGPTGYKKTATIQYWNKVNLEILSR